MPNPEVLTGMRQPRTVRLEEARAREAAATPESAQAVPKAPAGVTVYVSKYRRYRIQVTAPRNVTDPTTGRKTFGGQMVVAQFDEGVYRNTERDPATRAMIDEALQSNTYFGPFGGGAHFWLASEQEARMEAARVKSALDVLRSLPKEDIERFLRQGEAEDHALPAVEPKAGIRPIPAQ